MSIKIQKQGNDRQGNKTRKNSDGTRPLPFSFRALMTKERGRVLEALQLWGALPGVDWEHNCPQDWQHILVDRLGDIFEQARLDDCDPLVIKALIRQLATLASICEQWAERLEAE